MRRHLRAGDHALAAAVLLPLAAVPLGLPVEVEVLFPPFSRGVIGLGWR